MLWWFYKAVLGVTLQKALQMQHSGRCDMSIEARVNLGCLSGRRTAPLLSGLGWGGWQEGGGPSIFGEDGSTPELASGMLCLCVESVVSVPVSCQGQLCLVQQQDSSRPWEFLYSHLATVR